MPVFVSLSLGACFFVVVSWLDSSTQLPPCQRSRYLCLL